MVAKRIAQIPLIIGSVLALALAATVGDRVSAAPDFINAFDVEQTFAVSDENTQSKWLSIGSYPRNASNWPRQSTTLADMWPSNCGAQKQLPTAVGYRGALGFDVSNPRNDWYRAVYRSGRVAYFNGNVRNYPGDCDFVVADKGASGSQDGVASFGTQQKASWVNFLPGYTPKEIVFPNVDQQLLPAGGTGTKRAIREGHGVLVNVSAYGGWATTGSSYLASTYRFIPARDTDRNENNPSYCNDSSYGTWSSLFAGSGRPQLKDNVIGKGMTPKTIWGNNCNTSAEPYSYTLYANDPTRPVRLGSNNFSNITSNVYGNGTTLFRRVVNLTQLDIDKIRRAENYRAYTFVQDNFGRPTYQQMSGGLYISAVADDFLAGWFNGAFALTTETTVATENYFHISLKTDNGDGTYGPYRVRAGENILAFEVNDKVVAVDNPSSAGAGFAYALNLMIPPPGDTYVLDPKKDKCTDGTLEPGGSTNCNFTVDMTSKTPGVPPRKNSEPTTIKIECWSGTNTSTAENVGAVIGGDCNKTLPPETLTSSNTKNVPVNITVPNNYDKNQICIRITVTPSEVRWNWQSGTVVVRDIKASDWLCITIRQNSPESAHVLFFQGDIIASGDVVFENNSDTKGSKAQLAAMAKGNAVNAFSANRLDSPDRYNLVYGSVGSDYGKFSRNINAYTPPIIPPGADSSNSPINFTLKPGETQYYRSPGAGSIRVLEGALNLNARYHVVVAGSVQIAGDITIDSNQQVALGSIPNVVIHASGDIVIDPSVKRIDATLIAGNTLYTCGNNPSTVNSNPNSCGGKLTINGPTKAKNYRFWRTNTDTTATSAAEVFVFPPSAFMSPYGSASTGSKLSTDYELELPPRY